MTPPFTSTSSHQLWRLGTLGATGPSSKDARLGVAGAHAEAVGVVDQRQAVLQQGGAHGARPVPVWIWVARVLKSSFDTVRSSSLIRPPPCMLGITIAAARTTTPTAANRRRRVRGSLLARITRPTITNPADSRPDLLPVSRMNPSEAIAPATPMARSRTSRYISGRVARYGRLRPRKVAKLFWLPNSEPTPMRLRASLPTGTWAGACRWPPRPARWRPPRRTPPAAPTQDLRPPARGAQQADGDGHPAHHRHEAGPAHGGHDILGPADRQGAPHEPHASRAAGRRIACGTTSRPSISR